MIKGWLQLSWTVLLLLLFAAIQTFFVMRQSLEQGVPPVLHEVFVIFITLASSWLVVLYVVSIILRFMLQRFSGAWQKLAEFLLIFGLFILGMFQILMWAFYLTQGYALHRDVLRFLVVNWTALPQHLLQTGPLLLAELFIGAALYTILLLYLARQWAKYSSFKLFPVLACLAVVPTVSYSFFDSKAVATFGLLGAPSSAKTRVISSLEHLENLKPRDTQVEGLGAKPVAPVIVIMVESLRHDLIDEPASPVPFLKKLWSESHGFRYAYATASHSDYADLSVWYSRYPLRSPERSEFSSHPSVGDESLFSLLSKTGYTTAYISSQNEKWGDMIRWLDIPDVDYFVHSEDVNEKTWVNQYDEYGLVSLIKGGAATAGKLEDSKTLAIAQQWIAGLSPGQKFVLGINLQNTHFSYMLPEGAARPFGSSKLDFETVFAMWPEKYTADVRKRYFDAAYNVDRLIEQFVSFLKHHNLWDELLFVVLGDSGEAFYEHGYANHAGPVYDEAMRTLLLIKAPGQRTGVVHELPVSHIDVVPAILELLNLPPSGSFQGQSPLGGALNRPVYMICDTLVKQYAVVWWPWKYIETGYPVVRRELYHLVSDPLEKHNQIANAPEVASRLMENLETWKRRQVSYYQQEDYWRYFWPPSPEISYPQPESQVP